MKEQQVTTKDPKKVEMGKRLAEYNHKKREELKVQMCEREEQKSEVEPMLNSSMRYGIGAVLAVGVIGGLGYYFYQAKKGGVNVVHSQHSAHQLPQANKFEME